MKRRQFLRGIPVVTTAALAASQSAHASMSSSAANGPATDNEAKNKLRLSLARHDIPTSLWDDTVAVCLMWRAVLDDEGAASEFRRDPMAVAKNFGVPPDLIEKNSTEVQLLRTVSDPYVLSLARNGDYKGLLSALNIPKLTNEKTFSRLQQKYMQAFTTDLSYFASKFREIQTHIDIGTHDNLRHGEMLARNALLDIRPDPMGANVNVNVNVVANAAVIVTVAALVVVVVAVAVLGGGSGPDRLPRPKPSDPRSIPLEGEEFERLNRTAKLLGSKGIKSAMQKDYIDTQINALVSAADQLGLVIFPQDSAKRAALINVMKSAAFQSIGMSL